MARFLSEIAEREEQRIVAKRDVEQFAELSVLLDLFFRNLIDGAIDKVDELHLLWKSGDFDGDSRFVGGRQDFRRLPIDEGGGAVWLSEALAVDVVRESVILT